MPVLRRRQLTSSAPNVTANITLGVLPDVFRDVVVVVQVTSCGHSDDNPFHPHNSQSGPTQTFHIFLGPGQIAGSCTCSFDYNGGGYLTVVRPSAALFGRKDGPMR
jgi:hypothetical protein